MRTSNWGFAFGCLGSFGIKNISNTLLKPAFLKRRNDSMKKKLIMSFVAGMILLMQSSSASAECVYASYYEPFYRCTQAYRININFSVLDENDVLKYPGDWASWWLWATATTDFLEDHKALNPQVWNASEGRYDGIHPDEHIELNYINKPHQYVTHYWDFNIHQENTWLFEGEYNPDRTLFTFEYISSGDPKSAEETTKCYRYPYTGDVRMYYTDIRVKESPDMYKHTYNHLVRGTSCARPHWNSPEYK